MCINREELKWRFCDFLDKKMEIFSIKNLKNPSENILYVQKNNT